MKEIYYWNSQESHGFTMMRGCAHQSDSNQWFTMMRYDARTGRRNGWRLLFVGG